MGYRGNDLIAEIRASAQPRLYVISGPSGVGKDTIIDQLRLRLPDFYFAVTATTRPRRPGEIDGVHYFFITPAEFRRHLDDGEFMEHAEVYGNLYGVPKSGVRAALRTGRNAIIKVDVQGAATIRALTGDAIMIFLMPTDMEALTRRLWTRKTDARNAVLQRIDTATNELSCVDQFDYRVFNEEDQVDRAIDDIMAIFAAEQLKVNQREVSL
ncbi:MAG TPA: guanylate kinase [Chloroflexi bacterium]|nr:guanylate kinase [Chloroflexota bacterium]HCG29625.1 guanylate kinase [Chloroflexota bacterium]